MSSPIMMITTMDIRPGQLEAFKESVRNAVDAAEENAPQLMVRVYVDEAAMRAYSCQIHPDSKAILAHWRISDRHIHAVNQHMTLKRVDVFGDPGEAVMSRLRSAEENGIAVAVTSHFRGYDRFPA